MKLNFKIGKIIALTLAIAILFSIFTHMVTFADEYENDADDNGNELYIADDDDINDSDDEDDEEAYIPELEVDFRQVASRGDLTLYIDEELLQIKVEDRSNNTSWYSSPQDMTAAGNANQRNIENILSLLQFEIFNNRSLNHISSVLGAASEGAYTVTEITDGVRITFTDIRIGVTSNNRTGTQTHIIIPVEIVLVDGGLQVCVVASEIEENCPNGRFKLASVRLMPFFGAASLQDEGYFLTPDGSGSLIYFNQDAMHEHGFPNNDNALPIYGRDIALNFRINTVIEDIRMPVFGIRKNDNALLAVITESAPNGRVRGMVAGGLHNFNQMGFEYIHRLHDQVWVRERTWQRQAVQIIDEQADIVDRFTVTYFFVDNNDPSYVGMALRYQQYLIEAHGMELNATANEPRMYVEFFGGVRRVQNFLGFPRTTDVAITTFDDVIDITNQLQDGGVDNVTAILTHWTDNTTNYQIPSNFSPAGSLGGRRGFERMTNNLYDSGVEFFPDVNLVQMKRNAPGASLRSHSIQGLDNSPRFIHHHNPSTLHDDTRFSPRGYVCPTRMDRIVNRMYPRSERFNITGLSANSIGSNVYSSLGRRRVNRTHTQDAWVEALETLSQENKMHFSNPNAYAFPFASDITGLPTSSSRYDLSTRDVPFMQIVLSGLVNTGTRPINAFYNYEYQALRALETGMNLNFAFGARNFDALINTEYEHLNYINYSRWIDDAVRLHNRNAEVLGQITDRRIVAHQDNDGVTRTEFGDGTILYINFTDETVRVGGTTVEPLDFAVSAQRIAR